jgi:hypothetical protein
LLKLQKKQVTVERQERIKVLINGVFDFQELGRRALPSQAWKGATPEQQQAFKQDHPQIDGYYRWKNSYMAANPQIIPWITSESSELYGLPAETQAQVYQFRAMKDYMFPGVSDMEGTYFDQPENQRKAWLKQNPQLTAYWEWKRQYAATFTEASPYILSDQSMQKSLLGYSDYKPELLGNITPLAMRELYAYAYGDSLRATAYEELRKLWESLGKPDGSFNVWLREQAIPEALAIQ